MLFGRRKPGYTTTVDSSVDPEQAVLDLQKAELAAKKKPKAEVFDIDAASETAAPEGTGSSFDGSAAKTGDGCDRRRGAGDRRACSNAGCRGRTRSRRNCAGRGRKASAAGFFWPVSRRLKTIPLRISPPRPRRSCRS